MITVNSSSCTDGPPLMGQATITEEFNNCVEDIVTDEGVPTGDRVTINGSHLLTLELLELYKNCKNCKKTVGSRRSTLGLHRN